jgi:hypothetical protein
MTREPSKAGENHAADRRGGSSAAERALAEAEERHKKAASREGARPKEMGGREGPEPTRYGDWEKGGIASDF